MHQTVAAERGVAWIKEGWRLFLRRPGLLVGMMLITLLMFAALSLVPLLGGLAALIMIVVLAAGMYNTIDRMHHGQEVAFDTLFSGFRERLQPLLIMGLILLGAEIMIVIAIGMVVSGTVIGSVMMSGIMSHDEMSPAMMLGVIQGGLVALMLVLLLSLPLFMAYTFAIPLVCLSGREPVAALKASFYAVAANWAPFLVFGLIYIVLALLATIPLMLGWLVLLPLTFASGYVAYREVFAESAAAI